MIPRMFLRYISHMSFLHWINLDYSDSAVKNVKPLTHGLHEVRDIKITLSLIFIPVGCLITLLLFMCIFSSEPPYNNETSMSMILDSQLYTNQKSIMVQNLMSFTTGAFFNSILGFVWRLFRYNVNDDVCIFSY